MFAAYVSCLLQYISALLVSLSGQLLLELPHVNVLSKIDLLKSYRQQLRECRQMRPPGGRPMRAYMC